MNIDHYENRIIAALEGELSTEEYDALVREVHQNEALTSIWNSYKEMYASFSNVPRELPSERVKERFDTWMNEVSIQETRTIDIAQSSTKKGNLEVWRRWAGIAAIFVLVFGFWSIYDNNQKQITWP